jgi:GNAT superfamily N-acetyltransferase
MSGLEFRRATLDDAERVADLWVAHDPESSADPLELRHWWASREPEWTNEDFLIERHGALVGFAAHGHAPWTLRPTRFADVTVLFAPADETPPNLDVGYDAMEGRARQDAAHLFRSRVRENRADLVAYLTGRGYREDRRSRRWELDLATEGDGLLRMLETSRARMREQGIAIHPIADDPYPEVYRKLHAMSEEAVQDVPTTVPHLPEPFAQFMKWFDSPGIRRDRMWIARRGDDVVGVSVLSYPQVRGVPGTDWTATARSIRGRGVARALKLETLAQAMSLGVSRVRTGNDAQNLPILHLNAELGYTPIPGNINFLKDA